MISRRSVLGSISALLPASLFSARSVASEGKPQEPRHYGDEPYCPERFHVKELLAQWCASETFNARKRPLQVRCGYRETPRVPGGYIPRQRAFAVIDYISRVDEPFYDIHNLREAFGYDIADALNSLFSMQLQDGSSVYERVKDRPFFVFGDKDTGVTYYQCDFDGPHYTLNGDGNHVFHPVGMSQEAIDMHVRNSQKSCYPYQVSV